MSRRSFLFKQFFFPRLLESRGSWYNRRRRNTGHTRNCFVVEVCGGAVRNQCGYGAVLCRDSCRMPLHPSGVQGPACKAHSIHSTSCFRRRHRLYAVLLTENILTQSSLCGKTYFQDMKLSSSVFLGPQQQNFLNRFAERPITKEPDGCCKRKQAIYLNVNTLPTQAFVYTNNLRLNGGRK